MMATVSSSPIPNEIFRAYDIRGIVDHSLQLPHVEWLGYALGQRAQQSDRHTLLVGRDGRLSSPAMFQALTKGILATGCEVVDLGVVTSPMLYFAIHHLAIPHGIMITGSHNPKEYNGLKILFNNQSLYGDALQVLGMEAAEIGGRASASPVKPGNLTTQSIAADYLAVICDDIRLKQPLKIAVDCGNGAASVIATTLFERLGCDVIPLYCDLDGNFPNHHPDPGQPKNLETLQATVLEQQADLGLAFDGDGDRVGIVDNQGTVIWPDRLLMLLAQDVLSRQPNTPIIFDVKCSQHVAHFVRKHGGEPIMWKTGHSLIKAKMKETGALLAGELSGHLFLKERWYGFDDGVYAAARILEIVSDALFHHRHPSSSALFKTLPISFSTPEIQVPVTESEKFDIIQQFIDAQETFGGVVTTLDGVRVDFEDGFGLIRASNTSPNLILRFEANDEIGLFRIKMLFRRHLHQVKPGLSFE